MSRFLRLLAAIVLAAAACLTAACTGPQGVPPLVFAVGGAPAELAVWEEVVRDFSRRTGLSVELLRQPPRTRTSAARGSSWPWPPARPTPRASSLTSSRPPTPTASGSMHFMAYLKNSILIAALSAGLSVAVAAAAAYAVTRLPFRGAAVFLFAVLAVSMFPQISLVSYLFKLMSALGWINTYPALVLPYAAWTLPLCLWLLVSYFARLPRDLDRAARIMPVGIAMFEGLHGELPWGEIMAAATLSTAPVVALVLAFQRRIVQGLTRGAVKQ